MVDLSIVILDYQGIPWLLGISMGSMASQGMQPTEGFQAVGCRAVSLAPTFQRPDRLSSGQIGR